MSDVSALQHKAGDDSMKDGVLVTEASFASAQLSEVLGRLGNLVLVQLKLDALARLVSDADVEEHARVLDGGGGVTTEDVGGNHD